MNKEEVLTELIPYCTAVAERYGRMNNTRVEITDLIHEGIVAILRYFDRACSLYENPLPYLKVAASQAITEFCIFHSHLIRVPQKYKGQFYEPHQVDWLEVVPEQTRCADLPAQRDFTDLYQAVGKLPPRQRATIELRYGLNGNPQCTQIEADKILGLKSGSGVYQRDALRNLRASLSENTEALA